MSPPKKPLDRRKRRLIRKYLSEYYIYDIYPVGFIGDTKWKEVDDIEMSIRNLALQEKFVEISIKFKISGEIAKKLVLDDLKKKYNSTDR